jgi:hypothetical protein
MEFQRFELDGCYRWFQMAKAVVLCGMEVYGLPVVRRWFEYLKYSMEFERDELEHNYESGGFCQ